MICPKLIHESLPKFMATFGQNPSSDAEHWCDFKMLEAPVTDKSEDRDELNALFRQAIAVFLFMVINL